MIVSPTGEVMSDFPRAHFKFTQIHQNHKNKEERDRQKVEMARSSIKVGEYSILNFKSGGRDSGDQ